MSSRNQVKKKHILVIFLWNSYTGTLIRENGEYVQWRIMQWTYITCIENDGENHCIGVF